MPTQNNKIKVKKLPIRLGQFLKLANLVQDGFEAKLRIQNGDVLVNNTLEIRRGKQLNHLDMVTIDGSTWLVDVDL